MVTDSLLVYEKVISDFCRSLAQFVLSSTLSDLQQASVSGIEAARIIMDYMVSPQELC